MEAEKRCPSCKTAFDSVVAALDVMCQVGEIVESQSMQTVWDDEMECQANDLDVKIRASEAAVTQKLSAIKGEEKKQLRVLDAEKSARLKSKVAGLHGRIDKGEQGC